ncbi:hypothetical protein [Shewanella sp. SR44-3]|uniref:hypothetical protein n=1 Tax=Shewanella sp. SR44-3 TaxID=2760936 RepID=UPI0015FB1630|nr:hypothetical protein [Shewanella sp. SR44-3]MBB1271084.1 hypothetical protein [Shewanella sp. SR44-3]
MLKQFRSHKPIGSDKSTHAAALKNIASSPRLNIVPTAILATVLMVMTGCAFNSVDPDDYVGKFRDRLHAEVLEDGLKLFTYTARLANPSLIPLEERLPQDRPFGRSQDDYREYLIAQKNAQDERELWVRQVELGLEKTLEMSAFCRDGYHELNRFIDFDRAEIRGECKEGANDADRKKYPAKNLKR